MDARTKRWGIIVMGVMMLLFMLIAVTRCEMTYRNKVENGAFTLTAAQFAEAHNKSAKDELGKFEQQGETGIYINGSLTMTFHILAESDKEGKVDWVKLSGKMETDEEKSAFSSHMGLLLVVVDSGLKEADITEIISRLELSRVQDGAAYSTSCVYNDREYRFSFSQEVASITISAAADGDMLDDM